jgi:hypothetical protein
VSVNQLVPSGGPKGILRIFKSALGYYFQNLSSNNITVTLDPTKPLPLTVTVIFDTHAGGSGILDINAIGLDVDNISLQLHLIF